MARLDDFGTRPFLAGARAFAVSCSSPELRDTVEALFVDLPCPPSSVDVQKLNLRESSSLGRNFVELEGADWPGPSRARADVALDLLVGAVNQLALEAAPGLLHLHAGVVAKDGACALLAARSGTGKSTLTTALVERGWAYLTDETASISPESAKVCGFSKPLTIKFNGRRTFPHLSGAAVALEISERSSWQVPASRIGTLAGHHEFDPALILLLERDDATSSPRHELIEEADAVALLMQHALNVDRFGPAALCLAAKLVERCETYALRVGSPAATASLVQQLFDSRAIAEPVSTPMMRRPMSSAVPASVSTAIVGGRAVLHDFESRRVAALDQTGTEVWMRILEGASMDESVDQGKVERFVEELAAEGFIVEEHGGRL